MYSLIITLNVHFRVKEYLFAFYDSHNLTLLMFRVINTKEHTLFIVVACFEKIGRITLFTHNPLLFLMMHMFGKLLLINLTIFISVYYLLNILNRLIYHFQKN